MSLPASLSYRDLLWIAIPGAFIVALFYSVLGIQLQTGDVAVIILTGVFVGYVLDFPMGELSYRIYTKFSRRFRTLGKRMADAQSQWDFSKLETLLTKDEKQDFFELDGYQHLHEKFSVIFLAYAGYNLVILILLGVHAETPVFTFRLPSLALLAFSALASYSSSQSFLRYKEGIIEQYIRYATKYQVKK